jgi:hypothetical protein
VYMPDPEPSPSQIVSVSVAINVLTYERCTKSKNLALELNVLSTPSTTKTHIPLLLNSGCSVKRLILLTFQ